MIIKSRSHKLSEVITPASSWVEWMLKSFDRMTSEERGELIIEQERFHHSKVRRVYDLWMKRKEKVEIGS